tara:strand:+ start:225 stop:683 length:459 start_codon:yes stop_codon:yes gene_type:complete
LIPKIISHNSYLSLLWRLVLVLVGLVLLAVWLMAWWLDPDMRGYGTHEQLGFPPCSFLQLTGYPCPSCGMTTAFSYLAKVQVLQSFQVNPGGCLIGIVSLLAIPWVFISAGMGRFIAIEAIESMLLSILILIFGISITVWIVRIIFWGDSYT